jgi:hypothetical protein
VQRTATDFGFMDREMIGAGSRATAGPYSFFEPVGNAQHNGARLLTTDECQKAMEFAEKEWKRR